MDVRLQAIGGGHVVYLKLVIRADCLVVSFHEDEGESDEDPS
jgi:hypothetical protein